jgi:hypothetical protein
MKPSNFETPDEWKTSSRRGIASDYNKPIIYIKHPETNVPGVVGFILSLFGILTCGCILPLGLILSVIGLWNEPRGLAIAGTMIGIIGSAWMLPFIAIPFLATVLGFSELVRAHKTHVPERARPVETPAWRKLPDADPAAKDVPVEKELPASKKDVSDVSEEIPDVDAAPAGEARKSDSTVAEIKDEEAIPELKVGDRIMIHDPQTVRLVWLAKSEADLEALIEAETLINPATAEKKSTAKVPRTKLAAEGRIVPVENDVLALVRSVSETSVEVVLTVGESKGVKGWVHKNLVKDKSHIHPQYRITETNGRSYDIFSFTFDPPIYEFVSMEGEVLQRYMTSVASIQKLEP